MATGRVVGYPVPSSRDHEHRRRYTCEAKHGGCGRKFDSIETVVLPELARVRVVDQHGKSLARFERAKLVASIDRRVVKTLTTAERAALTDGVLQNLRDQVKPPRSDGSTGEDHHILLPDIQTAVFGTMKAAAQRRAPGDARERFSLAMIQYALGSFGERSRSHAMWTHAGDFLAWLNEDTEMFGARRPLPEPVWQLDATPWIVPVTLPPAIPTLVVKNFRPSDGRSPAGPADDIHVLEADEVLVRRRRQEPFDEVRIRQSLDNALYGRHNDWLDTKTIYHWLMWGFPGQVVLRTSQISSRIAETLRSLDDIAYLRWVVVGKELTVGQIRAEAEALIAYPSQRLKLSRSKLPPAVTQSMSAPSESPASAEDG